MKYINIKLAIWSIFKLRKSLLPRQSVLIATFQNCRASLLTNVYF